jgi:phosphatidylserine/phosphatidylglycerophosphate/cardiolipin synthase-like enzyme
MASFALNQEVNLTMYDRGIAHQLEEIFKEDLKHSEQMTYRRWRSRSFVERLFEVFEFPIKEQL